MYEPQDLAQAWSLAPRLEVALGFVQRAGGVPRQETPTLLRQAAELLLRHALELEDPNLCGIPRPTAAPPSVERAPGPRPLRATFVIDLEA